MQDRDVIAARWQLMWNKMKVHQRVNKKGRTSIFNSRVKGTNLHELVYQSDTFEKEIRKGYIMDLFFRKVIEKMGVHPSFEKKDGIIWMKNRGGEDIVCIPSTMLAGTILRTRILDKAHQVVGHYGPQCTSDYIR